MARLRKSRTELTVGYCLAVNFAWAAAAWAVTGGAVWLMMKGLSS